MDNSGTIHLNIKEKDEDEEHSVPSSGLNPIGFHYRFTFSDQDKDLKILADKNFIHSTKLLHRALISKLSDLGYFHLGKCTSGYEVLNKAGEHCKAHLHIAFKSTKVKEHMNKTIKRFMEEWEQEYIGNKSYSFKPQHIRCEEEFWRYPLKQGLDLKLCRGFLEDRLKFLHECAKDSWHKTCQVNQTKMDKKDKDDTLFLRVLSIIKKNNDTSKRAIYKTFLNYYLEENKPINRQVITGYVLNALVKLNLMTVDQLLDQWEIE